MKFIELYEAYKALREVSDDTSLPVEAKLLFLRDLGAGLPPEQICGGCIQTYRYIKQSISDKAEELTREQKAAAKPAGDNGPSPSAKPAARKTPARKASKGTKK